MFPEKLSPADREKIVSRRPVRRSLGEVGSRGFSQRSLSSKSVEAEKVSKPGGNLVHCELTRNKSAKIREICGKQCRDSGRLGDAGIFHSKLSRPPMDRSDASGEFLPHEGDCPTTGSASSSTADYTMFTARGRGFHRQGFLLSRR